MVNIGNIIAEHWRECKLMCNAVVIENYFLLNSFIRDNLCRCRIENGEINCELLD